ncbi:MAG: NAD(P)H-hydrate dehydratase, partial [Candidatus Thermoplasmatota archaeon]|nr:NAD(P)H-hydrate dehydratase [Candidatus Thermoplasmatota archaeon]
KEPFTGLINKINNAKKTIVSVDVPTGLGCNYYIKPNYTITFHDIKEGMNEKNCGKIIVADIGIPKKAVDFVGPGELITYYPRPKEDSHKGENGRVLVIGGGPYIGAPALSALAALRTGSDLVFIVTPKKAAKAITSFTPHLIKPEELAKDISRLSPNLIVRELNNDEILIPEDIDIIDEYILKIDSVVIGPGLGSDKKTKNAIEKIIVKCAKRNKCLVIDADAISVVGNKPEIVKYIETVITPHAGEFEELTHVKLDDNLANRKKKVEHWSKKLGVTILLKGPTDIISNGVQTKLNAVHNPAMTVGGTGDVLAGIVGSLLSKGVESFNAARIGAFLNGSAGNLAFEKKSYGLIATDIIEEIPNVLKKYL